jgi:tRNA A-37 threonylcarbamoyl transferase component Bud32
MIRATRVGSWRVWIPAAHREAQPRGGEIEIEMEWLTRAECLATTGTPCHRSKHAATYRTCVDGRDVYLKRYHRYRRSTALKDMLRASKARHVLEISAALAAAGFRVPRVLAAAEERRGTVLRGAWVATSALDGMPIADRFAALARRRASASPAEARTLLAEKRRLLAALGTAVARLHERGFVAGDLVPSNVWVAGSGETETLAFLDHDRTRAGRAAAAWMGARRNLVQLNRIVLAGVVVTDRARVYRAYVAGRGWSRALARRRLPWVIAKTIERRRRFDGVDDAAAVGFRALMRATQRSGR